MILASIALMAAADLYRPVPAPASSLSANELDWVRKAQLPVFKIDGLNWIYVVTDADGVHYFILLSDVMGAKELGATVWMYADHKNNKKVNFRAMKFQHTFSCESHTQYRGASVTYTPRGTVLRSIGESQEPFVMTTVPGTVGWAWENVVCWRRSSKEGSSDRGGDAPEALPENLR